MTRPKRDRYRLQAYITLKDKALVEQAIKIEGDDSERNSISRFGARATMAEARRIIDSQRKTGTK